MIIRSRRSQLRRVDGESDEIYGIAMNGRWWEGKEWPGQVQEGETGGLWNHMSQCQRVS